MTISSLKDLLRSTTISWRSNTMLTAYNKPSLALSSQTIVTLTRTKSRFWRSIRTNPGQIKQTQTRILWNGPTAPTTAIATQNNRRKRNGKEAPTRLRSRDPNTFSNENHRWDQTAPDQEKMVVRRADATRRTTGCICYIVTGQSGGGEMKVVGTVLERSQVRCLDLGGGWVWTATRRLDFSRRRWWISYSLSSNSIIYLAIKKLSHQNIWLASKINFMKNLWTVP